MDSMVILVLSSIVPQAVTGRLPGLARQRSWSASGNPGPAFGPIVHG